MKNKIGAIMLGVAGLFVCSGFGIAEDGELMAFDKVYENPLLALNSNTKNVVLPGVSQETLTQESAATAVSKPKPRLVIMKELLKDLSPEDRAEFVGNLLLKDGRVVSADPAPLKRTLTQAQMSAILDSFISKPKSKKTSINPGTVRKHRLVRLAETFKDVPADARNAFFDNMVFKAGVVASVSADDLKRAVSKSELTEMLNSLAPIGSKQPMVDSKLCGTTDGEGWCDHSACKTNGGDDLKCFSGGAICYSSCDDDD